MNKIYKNVIESTVNHDLCIGCGICAGVCPYGYLYMEWNEFGELKPQQTGCSDECNLCLEVCPFVFHGYGSEDISREKFGDKSDIHYLPETGYYLKTYMGYVLDESVRLKCSSGGLTTWLLKEMIDNDIIDRIICVAKDHEYPDKMFSFNIIDDSGKLESARGSKYYPVDMERVISVLLSETDELRYAVVGLPCQLYAVSLAMQKIPKLSRRISILVGLVCGQLPNRFYSEILSLVSGVEYKDTNEIIYRGKNGINKADNYYFQSINNDGKVGKSVNFHGIPSRLWTQGFFKHNACNFCNDVFAEVADITLMDAWDKKYINDSKGTSFALVRSKLIDKLLVEANYKEIHLQKVDINDLIGSQEAVVFKKKELVKGKIWVARKTHRNYPKISQEGSFWVFIKNCFQIIILKRIQDVSKSYWKNMDKYDLDIFFQRFKFSEMLLKALQKKNKLLNRFIRCS